MNIRTSYLAAALALCASVSGAQDLDRTALFCGFEPGESAVWSTTLCNRSTGTDAAAVEEIPPQQASSMSYDWIDCGKYLLEWTTAGRTGDESCSPEESCLKVSGFTLKKNTSYRLSFNIYTDNHRISYGVFDSKDNSLTEGSAVIVYHSSIFPTKSSTLPLHTNWNYVTQTFFYTGETTADAYIRISFPDAACTYYIDAVSICESYVASVVSYGDCITLTFDYETNMDILTGYEGHLVLPETCVSVTGIDREYEENGRTDIHVFEIDYNTYDNPGRIIILLEDDADFYKDIEVTFTNPSDPDYRLQFTEEGIPVEFPDIIHEKVCSTLDAVIDGVAPVMEQKQDGPYYDILGRPVQRTPAAGIYIRNGRKVLVK